MEIPGYTLNEILREDEAFMLWRGTCLADSAAVLVLAPQGACPAPAVFSRLEHEFALRDALDPAWAARPRALIRRDGLVWLVLEDPGGVPLSRLLLQPLGSARFLQVAIGIAAALGELHGRGLIHKDLKPANILVDEARGGVWLTGFGIASHLSRERQAPEPPEFIAGTLAYMAPEQTGRMNRCVDARSDLYTLGVCFYEMLTGALPFTAADPMAWVHSHMARHPLAPAQRRPEVPGPLSAMVMKLLAKTAEERYQTAAGVAADLRHCQVEWEAYRQLVPFALGVHDASERLLIPERLYGREKEVHDLLDAFQHIASGGVMELVLVCGYSGIGKSSVVHELHKAIVPSGGLFVAGKFDQYKRDIPYATIAQAFQGLVRQLLGKGRAELEVWREELRSALGANGQLAVNLIPELELIIGAQPALPDLPPLEAQKRFHTVFRRFLGVCARPEHPLVVFLDDLQWLDLATLKLLEQLAAGPELRHLLLVCAYRDNEVDASHPLMRTLEVVCRSGIQVRRLVMAPLGLDNVGRLVADALRCGLEAARPLAQLVFEKTGGNPFFAIQFLSALAEAGLVAYDGPAGAWNWDLELIRAQGYTDNVVDLLVSKLSRLPPATCEALKQLACLGNSASVETLALLRGQGQAAVHAAFWEAVHAGLVYHLQGAYRFLHDRVQEAAYALIPDGERAAAHLRIGCLLAAVTPPEALEERIFQIVNQLDRGTEFITSREERDRVAGLNLLAGKRARRATAYASALKYFTVGEALLAEDRWERRYELSFNLAFERAECEYLTGELAMAEEHLAALAQRATRLVDVSAVTCARVALYTTLDRSDLGVEACLGYLRRVGIDWSPHPAEDEVRLEYERIGRQIGERPIETLIDLPTMADPDWRATMDVLARAESPALFTDENLLYLVIGRMANLSLEHGNCDASSIAYVWLGASLAPHFGDYQAGFRFGKLGLDLLERRGSSRFTARVYLGFGNRVNPWARHVGKGIALVRRAFEAGQEIGDLTYAAYACNCLVTLLLAAGQPLAEVQREAESALGFVRQAKFGLIIDIITGQLGLIRTLRGLTPEFGAFNSNSFDEAGFERHLEEDPRLAIAACWYWIRKLQARFHGGDYAAAVDAAARAQGLVWTSPSFFESAEYHFYGALARAACCDSAPPQEREVLLEAIAAHSRQLRTWADNCPANFETRHALVAAEVARLEGRELDAEHLYEQAVRSAREQGLIHNEALANELAGRFHFGRGVETIALAYLRAARDGYQRWGAAGKVKALDGHYPQLAEPALPAAASGTIGAPVRQLDIATVVKASQALSSEIVLERLIETLMRIALEHAGADRALLLLSEGEAHWIEAEARTGGEGVEVVLRHALATLAELPESILHYVARSRRYVLLDDASVPNPFSEDPYLQERPPGSVLCLPLAKQAKLVGLLYLENSLAPRAFTHEGVAVLELLASQAAISLENASLYAGLQERENRFRRLVDANIIGVFFPDMNGGITDANDAFLQMLGYTRDELEAGLIRWSELTPPEYAAADQEGIAEATRTGACIPYEKEFLRRDRTRVPVLVGGAMLEGSSEHAVAYVLDLTERKRAEAEQQARQAAEAANRAKSVFLASLSHELRTPLNAILGYAQLLARETSLNERQERGLATIRQSGQHLLTLINDLLDLAKIEAGRFELDLAAVNLERFLRGVADIMEMRTEEKGLRFAFQPAKDLPQTVRADEKRLRQVLLNLLSNAVKFTDRGEVSLCIQVLADTAEGARLRFLVGDTGVGMAPEEVARLFQPFEQVGEGRRRAGGTGLGLTISRQLVHMMESEIEVESRAGIGSRFWFDLSLAVLPSEFPAAPRPRRIAGYAGGRRRVLIVDGEEYHRAMLQDLLDSLGFEVGVAVDSQGAVAQAEAARPDLVLWHLAMPMKDGGEAIRRLRAMPETGTVPIVAISFAADRDEYAGQAASGLADAVLPKPVDLNRILQAIGQLLDLRWIDASSAPAGGGTATPLLAPPRRELEALYQLALTGNMRDIRQQAARLIDLDEGYRPFAEKLGNLAAAYQSKAVLGLVESHLKASGGITPRARSGLHATDPTGGDSKG